MMVGQICRFTPGFVRGEKARSTRGEIGELYFVESEYAHDYQQVRRNERLAQSIRIRNGVVGGGCHAVDLLRWLAGDPTSRSRPTATHKMLPDRPIDDDCDHRDPEIPRTT